jgi:hypothetical protein
LISRWGEAVACRPYLLAVYKYTPQSNSLSNRRSETCRRGPARRGSPGGDRRQITWLDRRSRSQRSVDPAGIENQSPVRAPGHTRAPADTFTLCQSVNSRRLKRRLRGKYSYSDLTGGQKKPAPETVPIRVDWGCFLRFMLYYSFKSAGESAQVHLIIPWFRVRIPAVPRFTGFWRDLSPNLSPPSPP